MKFSKWILATALVGLSLPAQAATTDPLMVLYVWSGAKDDGGSVNAGVASVIHCSSFSNVTEKLNFLVKGNTGTLKGNATTNIPFGETITASTHNTLVYFDDLLLATGLIEQGSLAVLATSTSIFCTAQVVDASNPAPVGMSLHGIRFNPIPGTLE